MDGSVADGIIERFLQELERSLPEGAHLASGVKSLLERGLMGREDALVELCEHLASDPS